MLRAKKLSEDAWEFSGGIQPSSNVYYIPSLRTIIDTGSSINREDLKQQLEFLRTKPSFIQTVILTHFHSDHIGNIPLFPNATIYASAEEIGSYRLAPFKTTGSNQKLLQGITIRIVPERIGTLRVISTPGHTRGSICIYKEDDKILFTGDTLFRNGAIGNTKLPTSAPHKIQETLQKLLKFPYKELGPGHNLEDGLVLQQHH